MRTFGRKPDQALHTTSSSLSRSHAATSSRHHHVADPVGTIGDLAVQSIPAGASERKTSGLPSPVMIPSQAGQPLDLQTRDRMEARFGHDFGHVQVHRSNSHQTPPPPVVLHRPGAIQPKLVVGRLNDPLEHEADEVAEQVLAAPPHPAFNSTPRGIHSVPEQATGQAVAAPASVDQVLAGPGKPLEPVLRQDMEHRFGHDFSRVRVHASAAAEQSARDLNAYAYTVGPNIVFGTGQLAPGTQQGRRLIAHELTHVLQQARSDGQVQRSANSLSALPPILLGVLNGMDVQGETILGTYLYGGGEPHDVEDPIWTAYMEEHQNLRHQIFSRLIPLVKEIADRKKNGRYPIVETFHAEFPENSDFSGYALLHGSSKDVGDFQLFGWADVQDAVDPADGAYDIELELRFVFNDVVNPNKGYLMDRLRSGAADFATLGQPRSYRLSIHWSSSCLAEVRNGQPIEFSGYPSDRRRGIRPLPRARLDSTGLEKKRAKEIEAGIMKELGRNISSDDVAGLAERKGRLLWMFYRLSGYMGSTYLDRFSNPAHDDNLPHLLHDRLSSKLRAELMEALRGKRPPGDEPL